MIDSPQQKEERLKAIKKLMAKWLTVQATQSKAHLLISKNPDIRLPKKGLPPGQQPEH